MPEFLMPSLGADMDSGTLVEWLVKPGDQVKRGQVVAVVETSKGAIDIEIFSDGVVEELLVSEGTTVPVGEALALLRGNARGQRAREDGAGKSRPPPRQPPTPPVAKELPRTPAASKPVGASPAARRRAEELGLDIATIPGTGPGGAVVISDIKAASSAAGPAAEESAPLGPEPRPLTEAPSDIRAIIAAAMTKSKREIPHYYLANWIDLTPAQAWLKDWNASHPLEERLLPGLLMVRAVALALRRFGEFNGHFRDGEFIAGDGIHVGTAISLRRGGLVAPGLRDADQLPLPELMAAFRDLVTRARAGHLKSSEVTGGTITVTSLGEQGVEEVFPVIYSPQVAIVGFGTPMCRPWLVDRTVEPRLLVRATLAADHRVSDGHRGALFLDAITQLLGEPQNL